MSALVPVTFGLSPYAHAQQKGYRDCYAISEIQVGDSEVLSLEAQGVHERGSPTSYLEVELPQDAAEGMYSFLGIHDALAQRDDMHDVRHANCHTAVAAAKRWISPGTIDSALLLGPMLARGEVTRVHPRRLGRLGAGEVYVVAEPGGVERGAVYPAHSIWSLPVEGLHFSQLGWKGHPYIGDNEGVFNYYDGAKRGLFRILSKPRDVGSEAWYLRTKELTRYHDEYWADRMVQQAARVRRVVQGLGVLPTRGSTTAV